MTLTHPKRTIALLLTGAWVALLAVSVVLVFQASSPPSASLRSDEAAGPAVQFDRPFTDGVKVSTLDEANADLSFPAALPTTMRQAATAYVHDTATVHKAHQAVGFVVNTPSTGQFVAVEEPTVATTESLEALVADCDPASGCEATLKMIDLAPAGGTQRALLIDGPNSTGVIWIKDGRRYDVFGPPSSFSAPRAVAVATAFAASSS
jgi:hypothetical protein